MEEIDTGGFELAVLGAGNQSRLGRILMGSFSTKVLHSSPASVLITHNVSDLETPVRVLLGADGSEPANRAVEQMLAFMDPSSCEIEVVSVAEHLMPVIAFPAPGVAHATSAPTPEIERAWLDAAADVAAAAARRSSRALALKPESELA